MILRNQLTFEDIEEYQLDEEKDTTSGYYDKDFLKPLFCWMFAISYKNLTKNLNVNNARLDLYSTFIHSIVEGRSNPYPEKTYNEKWVLHKIADFKSMFEEIYEDQPDLLRTFIDEEHDEVWNSFINTNRSIHTI